MRREQRSQRFGAPLIEMCVANERFPAGAEYVATIISLLK